MAQCPFCGNTISDDLERFGGPCPHCFTNIHGEDAATDPGAELRARIEQEDAAVAARAQRTSTVSLTVALVLLISATVYGLWPSQDVEPISFDDNDAMFSFVRPTLVVNKALLEDSAEKEVDNPSEAAARKPSRSRPKAKGSSSTAQAAAVDSPVEAEDQAGSADLAPSPSGGGLDLMVNASRGRPLLTESSDIVAAFRDVFGSQKGSLQLCYDRALKRDESFAGRWKIQAVVATDGRLADVAAIAQGGEGVPEFERCVVDAIQRWAIAGQLKEPWPVSFPLSFGT